MNETIKASYAKIINGFQGKVIGYRGKVIIEKENLYLQNLYCETITETKKEAKNNALWEINHIKENLKLYKLYNHSNFFNFLNRRLTANNFKNNMLYYK